MDDAKAQIMELHADFIILRDDVTALRNDGALERAELAALRGDLSDLKTLVWAATQLLSSQRSVVGAVAESMGVEVEEPLPVRMPPPRPVVVPPPEAATNDDVAAAPAAPQAPLPELDPNLPDELAQMLARLGPVELGGAAGGGRSSRGSVRGGRGRSPR